MTHNDDSTNEKAPLEKSWHSWIDRIDDDPTRAWEGLYRFAQMFFTIQPPHRLQSQPREVREDLMADVVEHCRGEHFTALRKYKRQKGRPFSKWFGVVANNKLIDAFRKPAAKRPHTSIKPAHDEGSGIAEDRLPPSHLQADDIAAMREALRIVAGCIDKLPTKQQKLLEGASQGMKPQELTEWMGWPADWNKKASDDLREARKRLITLVIAEGIDPDEIFQTR